MGITLPEVAKTLKGARIVYDTREQDTPERRRRLAQIEQFYPTVREKCFVGDYGIEVFFDDEWQRVPAYVERKMSLDEIEGCITSQSDRFYRELERARKADIQLYLLVENGSLDSILAGDYRTKMHPNAFIAKFEALTVRHGVPAHFISKRNSGRMIVEILKRAAQVWLEEIADAE